VDCDRSVGATDGPAQPVSAALSNYCRFEGTRLLRVPSGEPATALTAFVHDSVVALALNPQFTCTGAKSALRQRSYRFALYPELGAGESADALAHDLYTFVRDAPAIGGDFVTFIVSFEGPSLADERVFEQLLWETLQHLHDVDAPNHRWADHVSANPSDPDFSFSFAETAFFVIGLHAGSSRVTRRFAWPTLVFNPHRQFEALKAEGRYEHFRDVVREAERRLQGGINPMSADFGERSEAAQYSGRTVGAEWRCPFAPWNGAPAAKKT
jgi:FPC/CPF motif-containing protein YcgG